MFSPNSLSHESFHWETAYSAALASQLIYQRPAAVKHVAETWQFESCEVLDKKDTQAFVAHNGQGVIISFRGTESLGDWITNLTVIPTTQSYGRVHKGFHAAYMIVHQEILSHLRNIDAQNRTIWITGHSLGGALASIAAAELTAAMSITGCYTFGQPRLGNRAFRDFIDTSLDGNFFRFVNDDDVVPRIPPGFGHVGRVFQFDRHGNLPGSSGLESIGGEAQEKPGLSEAEFAELQEQFRRVQRAAHKLKKSAKDQEALVNASIEGLLPSVADHRMDRYVAVVRRHATAASTQEANVDSAVEFVQQRIRAGSALESTRETVKPPVADDLVPVLLRLADEDWKAPDGLIVNSQFGNIVTAQASSIEIDALRNDPKVISIDASRDGGIHDCAVSVPFVGGTEIQSPPISEKGDAVLIGIIDSGVDVRHEAFQDENGKSRILFVWNQRDDTGPTPKEVDPATFTQNYGTLHTADRIQDMIDQGNASLVMRDAAQGHGTHVASIAAGRSVGTFGGGMAPRAKLMVVIPNMKTSPGDPPSLGYSNSHVDALFLLRLAAKKEGLPMVVNVSLGMNAGAHDGTSALEVAFDAVSNNGRDAGFVVVKSAGNERGNAGHAQIKVQSGTVHPIVWHSDATFRQQDYIELWYSSFDELQVHISRSGWQSVPARIRFRT